MNKEQPSQSPNKEETGLGGDTRVSGPAHAWRGLAFLLGISLIGFAILLAIGYWTHL